MSERYVVTRRLALTEDGRVVDEEHVDARWLYAVPGQSVPMAEAVRYGLTGEEPAGGDAIPTPPAAGEDTPPEPGEEPAAKATRRAKRARE